MEFTATHQSQVYFPFWVTLMTKNQPIKKKTVYIFVKKTPKLRNIVYISFFEVKKHKQLYSVVREYKFCIHQEKQITDYAILINSNELNRRETEAEERFARKENNRQETTKVC